VPFERGIHHLLDLIGKPLATLEVVVCPDLDQHGRSPCFAVEKAFALFDAASLEEALVGRVLSDVRGLALLCQIDFNAFGRLA
jgi:hypothetical protein